MAEQNKTPAEQGYTNMGSMTSDCASDKEVVGEDGTLGEWRKNDRAHITLNSPMGEGS